MDWTQVLTAIVSVLLTELAWGVALERSFFQGAALLAVYWSFRAEVR